MKAELERLENLKVLRNMTIKQMHRGWLLRTSLPEETKLGQA